MSLGILGKKVGMTRVFDNEAGCMIPVTVIDVNGNEFLQVKTSEKHGYSSIQVAYDDQKERRLNLPERTHQAKQGATGAKKLVKEFASRAMINFLIRKRVTLVLLSLRLARLSMFLVLPRVKVSRVS